MTVIEGAESSGTEAGTTAGFETPGGEAATTAGSETSGSEAGTAAGSALTGREAISDRRTDGTCGASPWPASPAWSPATKRWVLSAVFVVVAVVWWQVRQFTTIVVLAVLLAYVLNPAIGRLQHRAKIPRATAAVIVYALVALAVLFGSAAAAQSVAASISGLDAGRLWDHIVAVLFRSLPEQIVFRGQGLELRPYYQQMQQELSAAFRSATRQIIGRDSVGWVLGYATGFATGFLFSAFGLMVTFFASLYLAMDGDRVLQWLESKVPPGYLPAYRALCYEIDTVWRQFFRGQLVLAIIIGVMTTVGLLVLGIPYALPLGLIAGVFEVIPRLGPVLSVIPAAAIALVLPSSTLPDLPHMWLIVLVALVYIVIQQVENNILVPRILGGSVNLPPVVVLVGALAGAKVAGVPGIFLAAPVLGSLRVIGSWLYDQLVPPPRAPQEIVGPD